MTDYYWERPSSSNLWGLANPLYPIDSPIVSRPYVNQPKLVVMGYYYSLKEGPSGIPLSGTWPEHINIAFRPKVSLSLIGFYPSTSLEMGYAEKSLSIELFPNPTQKEVTLRYHSGSPTKVIISITNMMGRVTYRDEKICQMGENSESLALAGYACGIYFITLSTGNHVISKKLIITEWKNILS